MSGTLQRQKVFWFLHNDLYCDLNNSPIAKQGYKYTPRPFFAHRCNFSLLSSQHLVSTQSLTTTNELIIQTALLLGAGVALLGSEFVCFQVHMGAFPTTPPLAVLPLSHAALSRSGLVRETLPALGHLAQMSSLLVTCHYSRYMCHNLVWDSKKYIWYYQPFITTIHTLSPAEFLGYVTCTGKTVPSGPNPPSRQVVSELMA